MSLKFIRSSLIATALFAAGLTASAADNKANEALSTKMVSALETGTFDNFIADGDAGWQKLQKSQFDSMSGMLSPRLKAGYTLSYLGELKLRGAQVTLWRIAFKTGDDLLVTMAVKDGKVSSFGLPRI